MNYAILRTEKLKSAGAVWRSLKHAFREQPTPNADPARAAQNVHLWATSAADAMQKVRDRLPEKRRKDAVLCIEYLVTYSPERDASIDRVAYFNDALQWLKERHGAANVVYSGLHYDEKTPHMYAYVVPLDESTGRLNCRKWLGSSRALSEMQTDFAKTVGARHSLDRGIKGSRAKHQRVQRHYGLVNRAADQVAELGILDRASIGIGKPTKKALKAIEAGDSYLTIAQEHQAREKASKARQKAIKEREMTLSEQERELRYQMGRTEQQQAKAAMAQKQAQKQVQELQQQLEAEKRRAAKADELVELFRSELHQAVDELRALRPQQRDHDLEP